jgi:hypothetical protein
MCQTAHKRISINQELNVRQIRLGEVFTARGEAIRKHMGQLSDPFISVTSTVYSNHINFPDMIIKR